MEKKASLFIGLMGLFVVLVLSLLFVSVPHLFTALPLTGLASLEDSSLENINLNINQTFTQLEDVVDVVLFEKEENKPPVLIEDIPDIVVSSLEESVFDISPYFEDDEGDSITYLSSSSRFSISFENDLMKIIPRKGFIGTEEVRLYASDDSGTTFSNYFEITSEETFLDESIEEVEVVEENNSLIVESDFNTQAKICPVGGICTCDHLKSISLTEDYFLDNDIDCSGVAFDSVGSYPSDYYSGTFDGHNFIITGLTINNNTRGQGLFAGLNSAVVKNLRIHNADITGDDQVAILAGTSINSFIENVFVDGIVHGDLYVGGLVGFVSSSSSTINNSFSSSKVYGNKYVGGLVGSLTSDSNIYNSYSEGQVISSDTVGGLAGNLDNSHIYTSYSTTAVTPMDSPSDDGGLVGKSNVFNGVVDSYWDIGSSFESSSAGGTGKTTPNMKMNSTFSNWNFSGIWTMAGYPHLDNERVNSITDCVELQLMDVDVTGDYILNNNINCSETTEWNWNGTQYTGFDPVASSAVKFTGELDGASHEISYIFVNRSLDDYVSALFTGLNNPSYVHDFNLTNVFVKGNSVSGLVYYFYGSLIDNVGVTGVIIGNRTTSGFSDTNRGVINNSFSDVDITCFSSYCGGFIDNMILSSVIDNSYSLGNINQSSVLDTHVGGFISYFTLGTITNSFSTSIISSSCSDSYCVVGGFVGINGNTLINNSYFGGTIYAPNATYSVGGFVGRDSGGTISNSYSSSSSVVANSNVHCFSGIFEGSSHNNFYDSDVCSLSGEVAADGKPSWNMTYEPTFNYSGWDFNNTWEMCGYPHFKFENYVCANASYDDFYFTPTTIFNLKSTSLISSAVLEKPLVAKLSWVNPVDVKDVDFDSRVIVGKDFVSFNVSGLNETLNSTTNITLENISYVDPLIYEDDEVCSDCIITSHTGNQLSFTVQHFTNYSVGTATNLTIWDDSDYGVVYAGDNINFYANYTNSSGDGIVNSDCTFSENSSGSWSAPQSGLSSGDSFFTYSAGSFSTPGIYWFNVSCNNIDGYDNLSALDSFEITRPTINISNCTELQNMSADLFGYYQLVNNINCSETRTWNWNGTQYLGFEPVGNFSSWFDGRFNGNNYTVDGLFIDRSSENNVALFSYVENSLIRDVILTDFEVYGKDNLASFVSILNKSTLSNVDVSGSVFDFGLFPGGLLSTSYNSFISSSSSDVDIYCNNYYCGGFVSRISNTSIVNSSSNIFVNNSFSKGVLGGFISYVLDDFSFIDSCFSTGIITTPNFFSVGGFISTYSSPSNVINNSYSRVDVFADSDVGGFVGRLSDGNISNSYSTGLVVGNTDVGGFLGDLVSGSCNNNFWDNQTSNMSTDAGCATGLETIPMNKESTFATATWDFNTVWTMAGYPHLQWERYPEISDCEQLQLMKQDTGETYSLVNDVDCSNTIKWNYNGSQINGFDPVGKYSSGDSVVVNNGFFRGIFYGNNHTISNVFINRSSENYVGLFGATRDPYIVSFKGLNFSISGNNYTGGLIGMVQLGGGGLFNSVLLNSSVFGNFGVGGLLGYGSSEHYDVRISSSIYTSYYLDRIIKHTGFFNSQTLGNFKGYLSNSYSDAFVKGTSFIGGAIGVRGTFDFIHSYISGSVQGVSEVGGSVGNYSFYIFDNETSGVTSFSGSGYPTREMQNHQLFFDGTFDIHCDTDNTSIWKINDTSDTYPCLSWEENCTCEIVSSLEWNESTGLKYPEGVYELSGIYPNKQLMRDTFNITFLNLTAGENVVLKCFVKQNQTTTVELNYTIPSAGVSNENVSVSYTIQSGDFDSSKEQSWFIDNCSIYDDSGVLQLTNDINYPVYVKVDPWVSSNPLEAANAYQSMFNHQRYYFGHNDSTQKDIDFAFAKFLGGSTFEGICDDGFDNDVNGDTDCSDDTCLTLFNPSCSNHLPEEAGFGTFASLSPSVIGEDSFSTMAETCSGNICTVIGGIGGATVRYTQNVSQSGTFKVQYSRSISPASIVDITIKSDGTPSFTVSNSTTQIYNETSASGLLYKNVLGDLSGITPSSRLGSGSSTYAGSLNQVANISLDSFADGSYDVVFDVLVDSPKGNDVLTFDLASSNPKNFFENDSALDHSLVYIYGTFASDNSCNDDINNDLNYDGIDCQDLDCNGQSIGYTSNNDVIHCEFGHETTCWDGFDNDGDGYVDCADSDCNGLVGGFVNTTSNVVVKYNISGAVEVKCEYGSIGEGTQFYPSSLSSCADGFDNDADVASYGANIAVDPTSYSSLLSLSTLTKGIDCFDAKSCWGESGTSVGVCPLFEGDCTDGEDNDYDVLLMGQSSSYNHLGIYVPDPNFDSSGADCDDYDCFGTSICSAAAGSITEYDGSNNATCWDGIDNDLDAWYWNSTSGHYQQDFFTGFDCFDPDCAMVVNPSNSSEVCLPTEFILGHYDYCSNTLDDDFDTVPVLFGITSSCVDNRLNQVTFASSTSDLSNTDCWASYQSCGPCPSIENYTYSSCADKINNDYDSATNGDFLNNSVDGIDCADVDCVGELGSYSGAFCVASGLEGTLSLCSDGFDNDGDGRIDCADSDCDGLGVCSAESSAGVCSDGFDNDGDGRIDCADSDCVGITFCPSFTYAHTSTPANTALTNLGGGVNFIQTSRMHRDVSGENFVITYSDEGTHSTGNVNLYIGSAASPLDFTLVESDIVLTGASASEFTRVWNSADGIIELETSAPLSNNGGVLDLIVTFPVNSSQSLGVDNFKLSSNNADYAPSFYDSSVNVVESVAPTITSTYVGPVSVNYGDSVTVFSSPSDASGIYGCQIDLSSAGFTNTFETDCSVNFIPTADVSSSVDVAPTDRYDNVGSVYNTGFSINVIPTDITSYSDYKLDRAYYDPSNSYLDTGIFNFITGSGDSFNNCVLTVLDGSKSVQGSSLTITPIITSGSNNVTCDASLDLNSYIDLTVDGVYFINVSTSDSDSDSVSSDFKVFYVCNDVSSHGVTPEGLTWDCAKMDMDNDGVTEGIFTTKYNSLGAQYTNLSCDSCPGVVNLGIDSNGNGIDDACDLNNLIPVMNSVKIDKSPLATNGDDLLAFCNASDADLDNLTYYYRWYRNGTLMFSGNTLNNYTESVETYVGVLSSTQTSKDDEWVLSCLASDNIQNSSWMDSSITTIMFDGAGNSSSPFMIDDCESLQSMNLSLSSYYALAKDIDCINTSVPGASIWNESGFDPVGRTLQEDLFLPQCYSGMFVGSLDGGSYSISNLFINRSSDNRVGLFSSVCDSSIKDIYLINFNISAYDSVSSLSGVIDVNSSISNVHINDSVIYGHRVVGGLIANVLHNSFIDSSSSDVFIFSTNGIAGGFVGGSGFGAGTISNSSSVSHIFTGFYSGSFIGYANYGVLIKDCFVVDSFINSNSLSTGGFVGGLVNGNISSSFVLNSEISSSGSNAGGFVGYIGSSGIINNSYALSIVNSSGSNAGGFVGSNAGTILNSYSSSIIINGTAGFVGSSSGSVFNTFYDYDLSSYSDVSATPSLTEDMQWSKQYLAAGWDINCVTNNDSIWRINDSADVYPCLSWEENCTCDIYYDLSNDINGTTNSTTNSSSLNNSNVSVLDDFNFTINITPSTNLTNCNATAWFSDDTVLSFPNADAFHDLGRLNVPNSYLETWLIRPLILGTSFIGVNLSCTEGSGFYNSSNYTIVTNAEVIAIHAPEGIYEPICCAGGLTGSACSEVITNSTSDLNCETGLNLIGSHPHNFTLTISNVTATPGNHYCTILKSDGTYLTLNGTHGDVTQKDFNLSYVVENDSLTVIDKTIPWRITTCGINDNISYYNDSIDYRIFIHGNTWTKYALGTDDASRALDCYASIPNKYFGNTVKCTVTGDLNYALGMVLGYTFESAYECFDGVDNFDHDTSFDCSDTDCSGITYRSCPTRSTFFGDHPYLPDQPNSSFSIWSNVFSTQAATCNPSTNICKGHYIISGKSIEYAYTMNNLPSGMIKFMFKYGAVSTSGSMSSFVTNTLPSFTDEGTYAQSGGISLPDSEVGAGYYKTYFGGGAPFSGTVNYVMYMNLSSATSSPYNIELFSVYDGSNGPIENIAFTTDSNAPENLIENDVNLWHDTTQFIQGIDTSDNTCNDDEDNDLDFLFDCKDISDCDGVQIGVTSGNDAIHCETPELTCWDGFDNDGDGYVDCADSDCDGRIGAYLAGSGVPVKYNTTLSTVNCENGGLDNGFTKEGTNDYLTTGGSCDDRFDNDADVASFGANIACDGTYANCRSKQIDCFDPKSCWGRSGTVSSSGDVCPLFEDDCSDDIDNDFDVDRMGQLASSNWLGIDVPDPFVNTTGADCDDYDCHGASNCPSVESGAECFDGIDNDLDKYYWDSGVGNYVWNTSTGIDCDDPDCLMVTNPLDTTQQCLPKELNIGHYDVCRNLDDDDHDLNASFSQRVAPDCRDNQLDKNVFATRATSILDLTNTDCWAAYQSCGPCPSIENYTYDSCADGADNDFDNGAGVYETGIGGADCADSDCLGELGSYHGTPCVSNGLENSVLLCSDGVDNDGDGLVDVRDSNCGGLVLDNGRTLQTSESLCVDSFDNDEDSRRDCSDTGCYGVGSCADPSSDWTSSSCINVPNSYTSSFASSSSISYYYNNRDYINEDYVVRFIGSGSYNSVTFFMGSCTGTEFDYDKSTCIVSGPDSASFSWNPESSNACNAGKLETSASIGVFDVTLTCTGEITPQTSSYPVDLTASLSPTGSETGTKQFSTTWYENTPTTVSSVEVGGLTSSGTNINLTYGSPVDFMAIPVDDDSGICSCEFEFDGVQNNYWSSNSYCTYRLFNILEDDSSYTVTSRARDGADNVGLFSSLRTFAINVQPIENTANYKLSRAFYNSTDYTTVSTGLFSFITATNDDWATETCDTKVYDVSNDVVISTTLTPSTPSTINTLACSGDIDISSIASVDGPYFIEVNVSDSDDDIIISKKKIFYVCNDESSEGVTADGVHWSCKKLDMDNDGATEGMHTTLYNNYYFGLGQTSMMNLSCDSCPGVVNTGLDSDGDGIDDACDLGLTILNESAIPYAIFVNETVDLYIDAHEFSDLWVNITYPNNYSELKDLIDGSTIPFINTSLEGNYSLIFYANNSIGQEVFETDYFEVFSKLAPSFNVTVVNSSDTGIDSTFNVYYRDAIVLSDSNSNGTFVNELADTNYDLEFAAYDGKLKAYVEEVDVNTFNGQKFGMDVPENGEFVVRYGLETSYNFTQAEVTISYDNLSSVTNENNLVVYKCNDYNFTSRECTGVWRDVSSLSTQNIQDDTFTVLVNSFSGFAIKQEIPVIASGSPDHSGYRHKPVITVLSPLGETQYSDDVFLELSVDVLDADCWFSVDKGPSTGLHSDGNVRFAKLVDVPQGSHIIDFTCSRYNTPSRNHSASTHITIESLCSKGETRCDGNRILSCEKDGEVWLTEDVCDFGCSSPSAFERVICNPQPVGEPEVPTPLNIYLRSTALALLMALTVVIVHVRQKHNELVEKEKAIGSLEDEDIDELGEMKS